MTDQELKDSVASLAIDQQETDIQLKEFGILSKETDHRLKELGKQIGGLGKQFRRFTEGQVFFRLRKKFSIVAVGRPAQRCSNAC